jgi:hypothetical protein
MTNEMNKIKVEKEAIISDEICDAGIHTYLPCSGDARYAYTLNSNPVRRVEVSFDAIKMANEDGYVIRSNSRVYDSHGSIDGCFNSEIDHIFEGSKEEVLAHCITYTKEQRRKAIAEEMRREEIWRLRQKIEKGETK